MALCRWRHLARGTAGPREHRVAQVTHSRWHGHHGPILRLWVRLSNDDDQAGAVCLHAQGAHEVGHGGDQGVADWMHRVHQEFTPLTTGRVGFELPPSAMARKDP